jgi:hypothetical protein
MEVLYAERLLSGGLWEPVILNVDHATNFSRPDMELIGGLPGVASRNTQQGLMFWSSQRDGAGKLYWAPSATGVDCKDTDLAIYEVDGRPMLEFRDTNNDVQSFCLSEVARPVFQSNWGAPTSNVPIAEGSLASEMIDGLPMAVRITYYQNYADLKLYRGVSTQPANGQPYMLTYYNWSKFAGTELYGISIGQLNGEMTASFIQEDEQVPGAFGLHFSYITH